MSRKNLWDVEFDIQTKEQQSTLLQKVDSPIEVKAIKSRLSSKKVSIEEKLEIIKSNVYRILGRYKDETLVIKSKEELVSYIDKAIDNGVIAIDTETNNSLDPLTCKIMGGCIYTPGLKQAYIPINHKDSRTNQRLEWQLTEQDLKEQFDRLSHTKIIMHNAKFDYEVIKCTCDCQLNVYWDTLLGAKILDENERAGLKQQYIEKIDNSIEKYDIEHLFTIEYAVVNPDIFALYAATDAMMTYKLYEYQLKILSRKENQRLLSLLLNIEMPVMQVAAEMELTGVEIDIEYAKRLSNKYNKNLKKIENRIQDELHKYDDIISKWRLTKEAQEKPKIYNGDERGYAPWPDGSDYKLGKSKAEQLDSPVNLSSPVQLAILLYDVLKVPIIDKKTPRGTGEEILKEIDLPICKLILEYRGLVKLINTYIDAISKLAKNSIDGRVRTHFNQYGAATGRFSSSDPINLQNIPSHNKDIRMMFKATNGYSLVGGDYSLVMLAVVKLS